MSGTIKLFLSNRVVAVVDEGSQSPPLALREAIAELEALYPGVLREVVIRPRARMGGILGTAARGVMILNDAVFAGTPAAQKALVFHEYGHLVCNTLSDSKSMELFHAYVDIELSEYEEDVKTKLNAQRYLGSSALFPGLRHNQAELCADTIAVQALYPAAFSRWYGQLEPRARTLVDRFVAAVPRPWGRVGRP